MLKIDYFYYVIEIAEAKSISKAAENLYITQPYLSLALKRLEEELGVNLFNRTTRGVFLTTAGEKFLQYAQKIVEIISQAEHLSEEIGLDFQKLSVASMYSYTTIDLFHEFSSQKHLQGCQFTYSEMPNREVSDYVFSGNANVGILYTSLMELENFKKQLSNKSMTFTSLISEPLCAVLSAE
ncbi:MAG: LysR family transcriptional regulator, partial [Oscillospiraceae bacterium]